MLQCLSEAVGYVVAYFSPVENPCVGAGRLLLAVSAPHKPLPQRVVQHVVWYDYSMVERGYNIHGLNPGKQQEPAQYI